MNDFKQIFRVTSFFVLKYKQNNLMIKINELINKFKTSFQYYTLLLDSSLSKQQQVVPSNIRNTPMHTSVMQNVFVHSITTFHLIM